MRNYLNIIIAYSIMLFLIILVGIFQSWSIALTIFNYCMISAVMTLGANIQWGYAGLINFGIMGYTALGGLAAVLISVDPVQEAWGAGGFDILTSILIIIVMIMSIICQWLFLLPVTYWIALPLGYGLVGAWWSWLGFQLLQLIIFSGADNTNELL